MTAADVRRPSRFSLVILAGALNGAAPPLLDANRRLRDVLRAKGYALEYFEVPGGVHSFETWRGRLPFGIAALAPAPR